jgi:proteasome accessory factor B
VFRDLNMLEMARIPYYFDADSGGYRIGQHFFLPPVNLTISEALAMLVLTGRLRGGQQLPLLSQGRRAAAKLQSVLPEPIRRYVGDVIDRMSFSLGPVSRSDGAEELFDRLTSAVAAQSVCRMEYDSLYDRKTLHLAVHPLRLMFHSRAWYLLAWSPAHKETRTFKLARVRKLDITARKFHRPRDADRDDCFGDAWSMIPEGRTYDVRLHFATKVATNVSEVQWHRNQRVQFNPDGSAEFFVKVDGLGEITWWILGYGDQVEVISPRALRRRVADVAAEMVRKYREDR